MLYCYLNGKIVPEKKASVSIHDVGLLRGCGLFESLRIYGKTPFLLKEHYDRLLKSSKILKIDLALSFKELKKIVQELIKKNRLGDAVIKILVTGGKYGVGLNYDRKSPTVVIFMEKFLGIPQNFYQKGVKLITKEYLRSAALIKSTNYIEAISSSEKLEKEKAYEFLYVCDGLILESHSGNFFLFKKNRLITPKKNVLAGVTRNFIIKKFGKLFDIEERDIRAEELSKATECFVTGSCKEIVPVVRINNKKIGNGQVGPNTKRLINLYKDRINAE